MKVYLVYSSGDGYGEVTKIFKNKEGAELFIATCIEYNKLIPQRLDDDLGTYLKRHIDWVSKHPMKDYYYGNYTIEERDVE